LQLLWEYFTYKPKKYPLSEIVKPKLQKRSRDNILQITISAHIYVVKKNGSLGIKLFSKAKSTKPSG